MVQGEQGSSPLSCSYPEVLQCYLERPASCGRQWRTGKMVLFQDISQEMHGEKSLVPKCTWKEKVCAVKSLKKHNVLWKQYSALYPKFYYLMPQTLIFFPHKPKLVKLENYFTDTCWRGKKVISKLSPIENQHLRKYAQLLYLLARA